MSDVKDPDSKLPSDEWIANLYAQESEEPGKHLDAAILTAAAQAQHAPKKSDAAAAEGTSASRSDYRRRRWLGGIAGGLATAAAIVLSVSVFLRTDEELIAPAADKSQFSDLQTAQTQVRAQQRTQSAKPAPVQRERSSFNMDSAKSKDSTSAPTAAPRSPENSPPQADVSAAQIPAIVVTGAKIESPALEMALDAEVDAAPAGDATQMPQPLAAPRLDEKLGRTKMAGLNSRQMPRAMAKQSEVIEEAVPAEAGTTVVWQANDHLAPSISVYYPSQDDSGLPIQVNTISQPDVRAVEVYAGDRSDVMLHVLLYAQPIDIDEQFALEREILEGHGYENLAVAPLVNTFLNEHKAQQSKITFVENGAEVQLRMYFLNLSLNGVEKGVQVLTDPRSPTNQEMLGFLEFNSN